MYYSTSKGSGKPAKPRPDFPLFPHATGRWAKKIRGKLHYFGKGDDPDAALQRYVEERDDLYAGRKPRRKGEGLPQRPIPVGIAGPGLVLEVLVSKFIRAGPTAVCPATTKYVCCLKDLLLRSFRHAFPSAVYSLLSLPSRRDLTVGLEMLIELASSSLVASANFSL